MNTYLGRMIGGALVHIDVDQGEGRCFEIGIIPLQKSGDVWEGEITLTLPKNTVMLSVKSSHESLIEAFPFFEVD